ncbi:Mitochondrial substrate carrier family protein Q [Tetrabaena socialis]|uniref:Mitochondrial substrate carrier family protein Q n=1 Tax=Tetrabaena socialis TaxID=47790 RepID=A0A2J8AFM6_9CHLO|nr:Mitochondrial substrate carrier family protein Q [Tetrabaena socialis]|eukprot:PNH11325.1 Mitochondrial substrate carrier family protein Q [Tetrabaena socialis]
MASDAAVEAVGGAVGSVIALAATYPLMIVSTWQALESNKVLDMATPEIRRKYSLLPSPLREIFVYSESRGWRTFFGGLQPCLAATAVSQAIYFYLYSKLRQGAVAYKRAAAGPRPPSRVEAAGADARTEDIGVVGSLLVAGLAGCGNVLATNPVWVVSMQMQALQRSSSPADRARTAWQVASAVYREGGWRGFYKGLNPALAMVTNPTLQYILYEWLTARLLEWRQRGSTVSKHPKLVHTLDVFLLTALAKMGATLVTYPMLLVKSRLQGIRIKMIQTVLAAALLMSIKEQIFLSTKALIGSATPVSVSVSVPVAVLSAPAPASDAKG